MNSIITYYGPSVKNPPICIPLKSDGSKWNNNELRISLRSIEKNLSGEFGDIYILADSKPSWIDDSRIQLEECKSYEDCVNFAVNKFDNYVWFNDDIILLKPTKLSDLLKARSVGKEMIPLSGYTGNNWQKKLAEVRDKLHSMGYSNIMNFSSHTPYVFNSNLMKHVIAKFGLSYKTPLETAYFNISKSWFEICGCDDKLVLNNSPKVPKNIENFMFLNIFDKGLTKDIKNWLFNIFPEKSTFERV